MKLIADGLAVAAGSALGAVARVGIVLAVAGPGVASGAPWWQWALPLLTINALGAALMGGLMRRAPRPQARRTVHLLLTTGFCGGFTSFSAFALEALLLWRYLGAWEGVPEVAVFIVLSVLSWILAAAFGWRIAGAGAARGAAG